MWFLPCRLSYDIHVLKELNVKCSRSIYLWMMLSGNLDIVASGKEILMSRFLGCALSKDLRQRGILILLMDWNHM